MSSCTTQPIYGSLLVGTNKNGGSLRKTICSAWIVISPILSDNWIDLWYCLLIQTLCVQINTVAACLLNLDILKTCVQGFLNTTEPFNSEAYAVDAVMALALALNRSYLEDPSLNLSLHHALETVMFSGASVSWLSIISGSSKYSMFDFVIYHNRAMLNLMCMATDKIQLSFYDNSECIQVSG